MMSRRRGLRSGYTAIELMLVLSIVGILSAMTAPGVISSMRSAAVAAAAEAIELVSREARLLAMRSNASQDGYGVVVYAKADPATGRPRSYVSLTYGPAATPADRLLAGTGPVLEVALNPNVMVFTGNDHADPGEDTVLGDGQAFGWLHQYRSGHTVASTAATATPIAVGSPASPSGLPREVTVRSLDGRIGYRVAIYPIGLSGVEELEL